MDFDPTKEYSDSFYVTEEEICRANFLLDAELEKRLWAAAAAAVPAEYMPLVEGRRSKRVITDEATGLSYPVIEFQWRYAPPKKG